VLSEEVKPKDEPATPEVKEETAEEKKEDTPDEKKKDSNSENTGQGKLDIDSDLGL